LLKKYSGGNTKLLYPAGVERTFDFSSAFLGTKIDVEIAELYEIRNLIPSDLEVEKALEQLGKGAIFFYSHNTAKHVCKTLFKHSCRERVEGLSAIAISSKTAEPVLKYPWQDVYVADEPTEQSMVSKLHQVSLA
ncbi:MAG: uroporphyrinogen-III synthase, partial [Pseudomonadota bacterium]